MNKFITFIIWLNICLFVGSIYIFDEGCSYFITTNCQVERKFGGTGFHRDLETYLSISSKENLNSCWLLIKEEIPSGAYIDPNQLKFMEDFGGPAYFFPQFVDIEISQEFSPKIDAYFYVALSLGIDGNYAVNVTVPIHLRYHRSKSGSISSLKENVIIPHPSVFLMCDIELPESCIALSRLEPCLPGSRLQNQQCEWLPLNTFSISDWIQVSVPVGDSDLTDTVLLATAMVTSAAVILILVTLFRKPNESKASYSSTVS